MDTTQTESKQVPARRTWLVVPGLALSPVTFLFGGFAVLLAAPFVVPPLSRFRMFAVGLFVGVVVVRVAMLAGFNPVLTYAQDRAVQRIESALGAEVAYDSVEGDALNGRLSFTGLRADLPELEGAVAIDEITIDAGYCFLFGQTRVTGGGFSARVNVADGRLERWLEGREPGSGKSDFDLAGGVIEVAGDADGSLAARFTLNRLAGETGAPGWVLHLAMSDAAVTLKGRTHQLAVYGGITVGNRGDGLRVEPDLRVVEPEIGSGIMRGSIGPGGVGHIGCTVDELNLGPLWARYRKVDEYGGRAVGNIGISGELGRLVLDFELQLSDYSYYHVTAMGLDREHSFHLPEADLTGRFVIEEGRALLFSDVTLVTAPATLATGRRMNARGAGMVVLNGRFPDLKGRLEAVMESGTIDHKITWSRQRPEALKDVAPNLLLVGEQFPRLELEWEVEVKELTVKTPPLTGTLRGGLAGSFLKEEGRRVGTVRAEGELAMEEGKVDCLGLQADLTGRVSFRRESPIERAGLSGKITGALGDTTINCEVTGALSSPVFVFTGANMDPVALGRKLYWHSEAPLSRAEESQRRNDCARIFGAYAASQNNPFEARSTGKVSFVFR